MRSFARGEGRKTAPAPRLGRLDGPTWGWQFFLIVLLQLTQALKLHSE